MRVLKKKFLNHQFVDCDKRHYKKNYACWKSQCAKKTLIIYRKVPDKAIKNDLKIINIQKIRMEVGKMKRDP